MPAIAVSVIIPIYNGLADLPDLLDCLRSQIYHCDRVEYLLVDNKSGDGTYEFLQAASRDFHVENWNIKILQEQKIQSSYAARNTGILNAQGQILAFTDADCRPSKTWLSNLMAPFENPKVGLVMGEIQALSGKTLLELYADRQNTLSQKHTVSHPFCPYGQTANLAVRREILQQVGLFRPYLTTGGDADLCWRILRQTSWDYYFSEAAIVAHQHRKTLPDLLNQWKRYGRSNRFLHELHGVDLMKKPLPSYYCYRILRWLGKELPQALAQLPTGKANHVDLLSTPIGLLCLNARWQGQQRSYLPQFADQIAWPEPEKSSSF
ncbi:MAG: glycosyltransferase [Synechococcales bacterium]|nr:glycosyltransferase [Synechococcales bacterium]